jgi:hypothetical protein
MGFFDGIFRPSDDQADNGFISTIETTFDRLIETAGDTANELLPIWAGQQLGLQQQDQLDRPTFVPTRNQRPSQPNTAATTETAVQQPVSSLGGSGIALSQNTLLLIGGGVLLAAILVKGT